MITVTTTVVKIIKTKLKEMTLTIMMIVVMIIIIMNDLERVRASSIWNENRKYLDETKKRWMMIVLTIMIVKMTMIMIMTMNGNIIPTMGITKNQAFLRCIHVTYGGNRYLIT